MECAWCGMPRGGLLPPRCGVGRRKISGVSCGASATRPNYHKKCEKFIASRIFAPRPSAQLFIHAYSAKVIDLKVLPFQTTSFVTLPFSLALSVKAISVVVQFLNGSSPKVVALGILTSVRDVQP